MGRLSVSFWLGFGQESHVDDCAAWDGQITAALGWVLAKVSGQRDRFLIAGDDPTNRPTSSRLSLKFIKAHPSFSTARVYPFDESELMTSGHACAPHTACGHEGPTLQRCAPFSFDPLASSLTQGAQFASMCVHMP